LVCEDNDEMRGLLFDLLSGEFNVHLTTNGQEALESIARERPDVVLTDVMMPVMSGIELCARLKSDSETAGIPVVLVTSKAEREMKIAGLERGADDYVTKPFHSRELLARLRSFVRLSQLRDELARQNRKLAEALAELKAAETKMVHTERLAAVGELAAGVAHEANNPVNFAKNAATTMRGYVSECMELATNMSGTAPMSLKEPLAAIEELSGIVEDGLDRTGRLIGDLRDFAAPRQGERAAVDLVEVAKSALQLTSYAFQKAGVSVNFTADAAVPSVKGDRQALGQVLLNLLKNAAEAFEEPGGSVEVSVRGLKGGVEVAVEDSGPGVPLQIEEQVFDPFFSTKPAGRGTGLGLSISRQVVVDHGGSINVSSGSGGGARFVFWLPREASNGV
jgi:signal transduction histidine kinase